MDELEATLRAVTTAIGDGRIGVPMAARIVTQAGDAASCQAASSRLAEAAQSWFNSRPIGRHGPGPAGAVGQE